MSQIVRPPIPYRGPIHGGLHEGKRIEIKGYAPIGADRFTVNLTSGLDPSCDRPLHISVRFDGNVVVRNTRTNNSYGNEERYGTFPFSMGSNFTMVIQVEHNVYKIFVNGLHCWDYSHRVPYSRACSMLIEGDVKIERIELINKHQQPAVCPAVVRQPIVCPPSVSPVTISGSSITPLPCTFPIYGGIRQGMSIYISGRPSDRPQKFTINLQSGTSTYPPADIAFHFDARFFSYSVVRNTRVNGVWCSEENMVSHFPFQPGCNFDMIIKIQRDAYAVRINGQHFISFRHRLNDFPRINVLSIENDVIVTSIRYN